MRLLLASLLLALAAGSCGRADSAGAAPVEPGPLVEIVTVAPARAAGEIAASGIVGFKIETPLSFTSPGVIDRILVDEGDAVRRGQRLATLRRTGAGGDTAEMALARETAERNLARVEALFARGFVSQAALDDARLAAERARDSAVISAPAGGIILRRLAEPAQMAQAASPVLVLGDTRSGVVVRAPISSRDAARVRIGDAAVIRAPELASALSGSVARIAAKSDDQTGAFEAEVRVEAPPNLRSGMVVAVSIAAAAAPGEQAPAIVAPTLSLLDARADQGVVFVVDAQNVAHRRAVQTAGLVDGGVLIVAGLEPGERIVAAGAAYVRDGHPVRAAETAQR